MEVTEFSWNMYVLRNEHAIINNDRPIALFGSKMWTLMTIDETKLEATKI